MSDMFDMFDREMVEAIKKKALEQSFDDAKAALDAMPKWMRSVLVSHMLEKRRTTSDAFLTTILSLAIHCVAIIDAKTVDDFHSEIGEKQPMDDKQVDKNATEKPEVQFRAEAFADGKIRYFDSSEEMVAFIKERFGL